MPYRSHAQGLLQDLLDDLWLLVDLTWLHLLHHLCACECTQYQYWFFSCQNYQCLLFLSLPELDSQDQMLYLCYVALWSFLHPWVLLCLVQMLLIPWQHSSMDVLCRVVLALAYRPWHLDFFLEPLRFSLLWLLHRPTFRQLLFWHQQSCRQKWSYLREVPVWQMIFV